MRTTTTTMTIRHTPPLLLLLLLVFFGVNGAGMALASPRNRTERRGITSLRIARIQRHLARINKPGVRTIKSPDGGDIIDCIPRHRQPALDHPLLKDHKIQKAAERPKKAAAAARNDSASASRAAWQAWHHAGHCPRGTVPIRRSSVDDVLRAKSLFHFGKKAVMRPPARSSDPPDVVSGNGHEGLLMSEEKSKHACSEERRALIRVSGGSHHHFIYLPFKSKQSY